MVGARWAVAVAIVAVGCSGDGQPSGPEVRDEVHHDTSPPLREMPMAPRAEPVEHEVKPLPRPGHRATVREGLVQRVVDAALAPTSNFDGIGQGFTGPAGTFSVDSAPPDPNGDVGPNHIVEVVNSELAIFNKSGTPVFGPVPLNTLWQGFGGACQVDNDGDPIVLYDPIADRWVVSQFAVSSSPSNRLECVAVSVTPDPTGAWRRYAFGYGTDFPDYPKMGVWPDAYYETFNMFNGAGTAFLGSKVCAYDRAKMLDGLAATQICFNPQDVSGVVGGLLPADLDGARQPPAGSPNYLVALGNSANTLATYTFHVDFATPANSSVSAVQDIAVAPFTEACSSTGTCIPQSGTTQKLDSLGDRLMYRLAYRNFGDHEALVVTHAVTAGVSTGVRFYELRPGPTGLTLFQQGTYAPDTNFRWMSSAAMDQAGNLSIGFSQSSSSQKPSIRATGRLAGDAPGVMTQGEATIIQGAGSQTGSGLSRWGDYAMMAVDPSDDCTFWFTSMYIPANGAFNWRTRLGAFALPGCGPETSDFSIDANPTTVSVQQGGSGSTTINTAVTSGSAQMVALEATGLPAGASASISPSTVIAGNGAELVLSAGTAAPGSYDITVTGTSASATHATTVTLVIAPSDFSLTATPASVTIVAGSSATVAIDSAITSGGPTSIALSASGLPTGATASFSPTTITSGGSSTLTIAVASGAAAATSTVQVQGSAAGVTHAVAIQVTIAPPEPDDFSIGTSATSVTVTAGSTASVTVVTSVTSGNAVNVALSGSGFPAGVTASFSPTTVTSGSTATLTISAAATAASGTSTATVTGTSGSLSHATTITVTVVGAAPNDFSIVASPASVTVAPGGSTTVAITTAVTSGSPVSVALSVAGLPTGVVGSFSPGTITAGGSSTLTITAASSAPSASASATVSGTSGSITHTAGLTVTVANGIQNAGFEARLASWTVIGSAGTSRTAHSGRFAALVGDRKRTPGDSSLSQTFTIPSQVTTLSLFYQPHCSDVVAKDWATATLRDNATGVTRVILDKTCTNDGVWRQASAAVVAGHSVTLTLLNHDDNQKPDPTFTLFDDVELH